MSKILKAIEDIVGPEGIIERDEAQKRPTRFGMAGEPSVVEAIIRPKNTDEVSRVMKLCHDAGQAIIPVGGNTNLVGSTIASAGEMQLSTERMRDIEDIDTLGRTMTVQSGAILQMVQEAADDNGLLFPLDLGGRGVCTIGGNISTNAGGNGVIRYGMMRDLVLGLEVVMADGTVVSSLNTLIKNNTGVDLKQMFIGAEGTLGIITRAVLKLKPKHKSRLTAIVALESFDDMTTLLNQADASFAGTLSAFEAMWDSFYKLMTADPKMKPPAFEREYPFYVLLEVTGGDEATDRTRFENVLAGLMEQGIIKDAALAQSDADRDAFWGIRDNIPQLMQLWPMKMFDVSVPLKHMSDYVDEINKNMTTAYPDHRMVIFGHLGDGNLHVVAKADDDIPHALGNVEDIIYGPLRGRGGSVSAEHGIGLDKKAYLHLSRNAQEIAVMKALKATLDPKGLLNPGKVF
jgi:FAD/FMN-containing dehydrogenase